MISYTRTWNRNFWFPFLPCLWPSHRCTCYQKAESPWQSSNPTFVLLFQYQWRVHRAVSHVPRQWTQHPCARSRKRWFSSRFVWCGRGSIFLCGFRRLRLILLFWQMRQTHPRRIIRPRWSPFLTLGEVLGRILLKYWFRMSFWRFLKLLISGSVRKSRRHERQILVAFLEPILELHCGQTFLKFNSSKKEIHWNHQPWKWSPLFHLFMWLVGWVDQLCSWCFGIKFGKMISWAFPEFRCWQLL